MGFLQRFVLGFFLEYSRCEIPHGPNRILLPYTLTIKSVADSHRFEGCLLPLKHLWQVDDGWSRNIFCFDPPVEVRDGKQWDIAEGHCFKLGERKAMSSSKYALQHEPRYLGKGQQLRGTV